MTKYGARKVHVDGFIFESELEAETYYALKDIHDCGAIKNLCLQLPYNLHGIDGKEVCIYQLDFLTELHSGQSIAFESKGKMTRVASLKIKLFKSEYQIPFILITDKNIGTLKTISSIVRTTVKSYRFAAFESEIQEQLLSKTVSRRRKKLA